MFANLALEEAENLANIPADHLKAHAHLNLRVGPYFKLSCTLGALDRGDSAFSSGPLAGGLPAQGFTKNTSSGLGRQNGIFLHAQNSTCLLELDGAVLFMRAWLAVFQGNWLLWMTGVFIPGPKTVCFSRKRCKSAISSEAAIFWSSTNASSAVFRSNISYRRPGTWPLRVLKSRFVLELQKAYFGMFKMKMLSKNNGTIRKIMEKNVLRSN